jgi:pyruvate dehydrogenase E1 component
LPKGSPIIAATDYVRALPQLIGSYVEDHYVVLGTDGFGRSDTRTALRKFFEIDRHQIVLSALWGLVHEGKLSADACSRAIEKYDIKFDETAPWEC